MEQMKNDEYTRLCQMLERLDKCDIFMKSFIWKEKSIETYVNAEMEDDEI